MADDGRTPKPLLRALAGEAVWPPPLWLMRQAGRYLPEYREVRANVPMLDACFDDELVAEITMQPVRRHDADAAILFSDIVVPLKAAGVDLDIVPGRGPVVAQPGSGGRSRVAGGRGRPILRCVLAAAQCGRRPPQL